MIRHNCGFSLLEVAIVLAIIGIIAGVSLPALNKHLINSKIAATKERMEHITHVLSGYVLAHGTLPCPSADPQSGRALAVCSTAATAHGFLPYETLGLDEKMARDAFGKRFVYVRESTLRMGDVGVSDYQAQFCFNSDHPRMIKLKINQQETRIPRGDFISFVLISTGAVTGEANLAERNNLLHSGDISTGSFRESGPNQFRQIIKWETRNNLMAAYGKSPCRPNAAVRVGAALPVRDLYFRDG